MGYPARSTRTDKFSFDPIASLALYTIEQKELRATLFFDTTAWSIKSSAGQN